MIKKGMRSSLKTGLSFGLTSGVITTMGLIVGLQSGTRSKLAIIGGIITIAIADALSDSLGIHVAEEAENNHTPKQVWASTLITFFSKLLFASSFLIPMLFFSLDTAVIVGIAWGFLALSITSYIIAKQEDEKPAKVIVEHVFIGIVVVLVTHFIGNWTSKTFSD